MVERALRQLSDRAGRGTRGVVLADAASSAPLPGPPMPNWTQLLLRELWRGFWRSTGGAVVTRFQQEGALAVPKLASEDNNKKEKEKEDNKAAVVKVSSGAAHSLFLNASGEIFSCGYGGRGSLGHGDLKSRYEPQKIEALGSLRVRAMSAGIYHNLFLAEDGSVYSCGKGDFGQLGHGDTQDQDLPKRVEGLSGVRVCAVSAGHYLSLFLAEDGAVYSCGYGGEGRLGHGDEENQFVPRRIEALRGTRVCAMSAKMEHSLFASEEGFAFSTGKGSGGTLGHGSEENQLVPRRIEALRGVRVCAVSVGTYHSLFLTESGAVYSCGLGGNGKLGHGDTAVKLVPARIESLDGTRVCAISAGANHSLFVAKGGAVLSCGGGVEGKLGHGDGQRKLVPHRIEALRGVRICAVVSSQHTLFLGEDGRSIYSCGRGRSGRLGHGNEENQLLPRRIEALPAESGGSGGGGGGDDEM